MEVRVTERERAGESVRESGGRCGENRREVSMKSGNIECKYIRRETEMKEKSSVEGSKSDRARDRERE